MSLFAAIASADFGPVGGINDRVICSQVPLGGKDFDVRCLSLHTVLFATTRGGAFAEREAVSADL